MGLLRNSRRRPMGREHERIAHKLAGADFIACAAMDRAPCRVGPLCTIGMSPPEPE